MLESEAKEKWQPTGERAMRKQHKESQTLQILELFWQTSRMVAAMEIAQQGLQAVAEGRCEDPAKSARETIAKIVKATRQERDVS